MRRFSILLLILTILPGACSGSGGGTTPTPEAERFTEFEQAVAEQRQLPLSEPVAVTLISGDALAEKAQDDLATYYAGVKAQADAEIYWLLGFVEQRNLDLVALRSEFYGSQVGANYVPDEHRLYIVREDAETAESDLILEDFSPLGKLLLWREVIHSLQHQNFELGNRWELLNQMTADAFIAYLSLIEGDARYWEMNYFATEISRNEQDEIRQEIARLSEETRERRDEIPDFILALGRMPGNEGQRLIEYAHTSGNVERIDQLFAAPPVSSEQVLHPQKYWSEPDDLPVEITLEDLSPELGAGWSLTTDDVIGEWHLRYLLEHHGAGQTEFKALQGADGWGGDLLQLYENGTDALVILTTVWDTDEDAAEFQSAFTATLDDLAENDGIWQDGERYITVTSDSGAVTIIAGTTDAVTSVATTAVSS